MPTVALYYFVNLSEGVQIFIGLVYLILRWMWHGISAEDDLRIEQNDVLERVAQRVGLALEDEGPAVVFGLGITCQHHLLTKTFRVI